jgi:hypothetical protein
MFIAGMKACATPKPTCATQKLRASDRALLRVPNN